MPCRTDDCYDSRNYPSGVTQDKYDKLKKEADNVTRLLCSVMGTLDRIDHIKIISEKINKIDGLKEWWDHHKEIDRKRIEKEVDEAIQSLDHLSQDAKDLLIKILKGEN